MMKLIDVLVRELPKHGGWPVGVGDIEMLSDGTIYFDGDEAPESFKLPQCDDGWSRLKSARDYSNAVTREQYEAALAASKTKWDGDGYPPVGCECEIKRIAEWMPVTIKFISDYHTVFKTFGGTEGCYQTCSLQFRPIRSEEDMKKEKSIKQLARIMAEPDTHNASIIYSAIADGKVPGIKLE
ncbi:hypothetical protein [Citrobacter sedlakii]